MAAAKKEETKSELKRLYVDVSPAHETMLRDMAHDSRISKKRFHELLIENEFKRAKKK